MVNAWWLVGAYLAGVATCAVFRIPLNEVRA